MAVLTCSVGRGGAACVSSAILLIECEQCVNKRPGTYEAPHHVAQYSRRYLSCGASRPNRLSWNLRVGATAQPFLHGNNGNRPLVGTKREQLLRRRQDHVCILRDRHHALRSRLIDRPDYILIWQHTEPLLYRGNGNCPMTGLKRARYVAASSGEAR